VIDIEDMKVCKCDICRPYKPQGICAPMMQIGWCVECGMPETKEQLDKLKGMYSDLLLMKLTTFLEHSK
tara:strand:- start:333 stop:539 length:207 start_codon:yes stop_codon:yes gene_type:complete